MVRGFRLSPLWLMASACMASSALAAPQPGPHTIGLVLTDWHFALYQTPKGERECPEGFLHDLTANYKSEYPTPEARKAREEQFGYYTNRGPNGENVFFHPDSISDPLPFRQVHGDTAIGLNLDDESDGKGRGPSLPHGNFTSPDGKDRGIDNQLYRVIGCTPGWRTTGGIDGPTQIYTRSELQNRILVEITGVDDEQNDDDVTVTTYRGLDQVAVDLTDHPIPWLSQRIDYDSGRRSINRLKGKIVDGVLITEPAPLRISYLEKPGSAGERRFKGARLRLKLNPTGAEGLLGGYADAEHWFMMYAKTWGGYKVADIEGWSAPATYQALKQAIDYRDPQTGKAYISAAYLVGFTRTFIIHSRQGDAQVASLLSPAGPSGPDSSAPKRLASQ